MNILFTNFCNKDCAYCFAKSKLNLRKTFHSSYISFKNLKIVIDFLNRSKITEAKVMGGEPTLHPQFRKAIAMIINNGIRVSIFSNGLIKKDTALFLKGLDVNKWYMVLNINSPQSYTKKEWSIINGTANLLNRQISLSFNIYEPDYDMDFIVSFIQRHNTQKEIRLGLAVPIFGGSNKYVELKDYPKIANNIVEFVEKNYRKGISVVFDCGFTLCSFTDAQLGKIFRFGTSLRFYCPVPIDVEPDLTLWRCFPTSMIWNKKLSDFKDLNAVYKFYNKKSVVLRRMGSKAECFRCKHLKLNYCSGGCLGHTLKSFKLEGNIARLA